MPEAKRPGKKGIYVELPEDLDAEFRAFVDRVPLGTISQHVAMALRRHMANPPTVAVPDLPGVKVDAPPAKGGRAGKGRKGKGG